MKNLTPNDITKQLAIYTIPELGCDLVTAKAIRDIVAIADHVQVNIQLSYPLELVKAQLEQNISDYLQRQLQLEKIVVKVSWKVPEVKITSGLRGLAQIKNIIAVASGKGGVGKSTTAVNIALALAAEGATVGILDADIYGPSIPTMLGIHAKPESKDGKTIEPLMAHGLQVMSVGFLIDAEQPMIWRGPMVSKTLQQIMQDTNWRALDYLIIDLPPGTGDVQLTMAQKIPVTAGIIVTTPQDIALQDAKRGLQMFNKVNIPVLGIVENMSLHTCSQCGHTEAIFGEGGGQQFADQYQVPLLGQLPLVASICKDADRGVPTVAAAVDSELSQRYRAIAREASARLSLLGRDLARKFPPINIE